MKIIETYEYRIPVWALPALVNRDFTGLSDLQEEKQVRDFEERLRQNIEKVGGSHGHLSIRDGEPYFQRSNAFDCLPCDVVDCDFVILK